MTGGGTPTESVHEDGRIRIAYAIDQLFLPAGGTETQLVYLLENLDRTRFAPTVFCLQNSDWLEQGFEAAETKVLGIHLSRNPSVVGEIRGFAARLREGRFDIVQTQFRDSNIVGTLAAAWAGVGILVSTRRGVPYWSTPGGLWFLKLLDRRATRFLANSEATRGRLVATEGVDASKVDVIHNGIDTSRFQRLPSERREELRGELAIPTEAPVVGIVANQRAVKGNDVFLRAAAKVHARHSQVQFVLVGEGPENDALRRLAAELGLESCTHFLGSRRDVPTLLQVFDVGVLASHFESFSNSILEYLASDLPVVVTDVGGAREAVRDGVDGVIVPPGRPDAMAIAILDLLEQPGGARAWRREPGLPRRFHLRGMVEAHERYYDDLVRQHGD